MVRTKDRTNLIFHHDITDLLDQAAKLLRVFCTLQESCNSASLCQGGEIVENVIQLPSNLSASVTLVLNLAKCGLTAQEYSFSLPLCPRPWERALPAISPIAGPWASMIQSFDDTPSRSGRKVRSPD